MQRTIILVTLLFTALLLIGGVVWWVVGSSQPTPPPTQTTHPPSSQYSSTIQVGGEIPNTEAQAAKAAYEAVLATDNPDNIKTYQTSVYGGYALQLWVGDNMGGQALLKYATDTNTWVIVDPGGGAWSVEGLVMFGVPTTTADELLKGISR